MTISENFKTLPMSLRPRIRYWLPAAAMDESDLRAEIRALCERGFGGVEVVVLEAVPPDIARGEDGWGSENWDRLVAVIADETEKLGMAMDIAIGPGWPIASPEIKSADDPAALCELVWGVADAVGSYRGALPERNVIRDEGTPTLVAALAYRVCGENTLERSSYIDLMPFVHDGSLSVDLPDGEWKIFAFYRQPACHRINSGQTFAVDHLSVAGAEAVERYWDRVLTKYPMPSLESFFCDSLEYQTTLDWTPDFPAEFENRRGYSLLPYLPFIGYANLFPAGKVPGFSLDDGLHEQINRDYAEALTQCYCENHLASLERIAAKHGKTVRYQVAYNKSFEEERSALYVSIPENEALGRTFLDGQKQMSAATHLGRKERQSFEVAAEFGHSYGQSYEDLFWWIKRSLMAGMNAQVLHGASYSGAYHGKYSADGQIPGVAWPGYEGFGKFVSNYWNRTLSATDARGCTDTITRLNAVFRGTAKVDCAVFRMSYTNDGIGSDHDYYPDGGKLMNRGYTFEFVSDFLLHLPVCAVTDGVLDADGVGYRCLIVPPQSAVSTSFLRRAKELAESGLAVVWVGERPSESAFLADVNTPEKLAEWQTALDEAWSCEKITHVDTLESVPNVLTSLGILPRVRLDGSSDVITATRTDGEATYAALYGYNRITVRPDGDTAPDFVMGPNFYKIETVKPSYERPGAPSRRTVRVSIEGEGAVSLLDPWSGACIPASFRAEDGCMVGDVALEEDELVILCLEPNKACEVHEVTETCASSAETCEVCGDVVFDTLTLESFEPNAEGETSFLRSGFVPFKTIPLGELTPWRELDDELKYFAGRGTYHGRITLPAQPHGRCVLTLGDVSDTFSVRVNGVDAPFPDQVMKRVDLTDLLREGENELEVVVTSNLYNKLFRDGVEMGRFTLPSKPRDYGIWESDGKKIQLTVET